MIDVSQFSTVFKHVKHLSRTVLAGKSVAVCLKFKKKKNSSKLLVSSKFSLVGLASCIVLLDHLILPLL